MIQEISQSKGQPSDLEVYRQMSELEERERQLELAIDDLRDALKYLENKLARTLIPENTPTTEGAVDQAPPIRCQAASFLLFQEIRIRNLCRFLEDIISRCQL